jgi:Mg-chelatase subunit ChlD
MFRSSIRCWKQAALLATAACLSAALPAVGAESKPALARPKIEVVFCLDTTGSMGGLIEGAKQKIWSISNQIAGGKPTPELKIGLVAYRDRGDAYITRITDLTDDLDAIHGKLREFQAQGGGDGPESVNQALDDAVNKIKWSNDKKTLRIIFLVGDAPPHMDYPDDVKYPATCKKACEKGIIINTIQCGGDMVCQMEWKKICKLAEGSYVQIAQNGGVEVAIATPFDKRLTEINGELAKTTLVFGNRHEQTLGLTKNAAAEKLDAPAAAARAAYQCKNGWCATYDLLDNIKQGKVKLEELKKEQLPAELQKLDLKEQKVYLDKLDKRRAELRKECLELDKKRADWIVKKRTEAATKGKDRDGFDGQVLEVLRSQAKKNGIAY